MMFLENSVTWQVRPKEALECGLQRKHDVGGGYLQQVCGRSKLECLYGLQVVRGE